ncbi:MAG: B-box zinc finger protein [Verrucomicrobia bacterium]|nr:B-box zinc finger protein [Verrucomicrobiota bacterium]MCH8526477.1 B-box zinc finger protein [Kiritimatiellia bacterium]
MSLPEITCPVCHKIKFPLARPGRGEQVCPCSKKKRIQFHRFPAYERVTVLPSVADTGFVEGASTCFHHPNHKAVAVCADCGVFVCSLCVVEDRGDSVCLSCFAKRQQNALKVDAAPGGAKRIVYDNLALMLAVVPVLFFWASILTAPAALFVVIRYWNRHPCSVVPRTRARFVFAALLALAQITGWVFFFIALMENMV